MPAVQGNYAAKQLTIYQQDRKGEKMKLKNKRTECIGNCGTMVLDRGECRKCRRVRLHAGLKRVKRMRKGNSLYAKILRVFEGAKAQFNRAKNIIWMRPKRVVRGLHITQRYQPRDEIMSAVQEVLK